MTRHHLLKLFLQPRPTPSVWRMTLDVIGLAFAARPSRGRGRDR